MPESIFDQLPVGFETVLNLSSMGQPLYSARGLKQTLTPISAAGFLQRDINGSLCNLSDSNFTKYSSVITGEDQAPPAFDDVWPGKLVTVSCICELAYPGYASATRTAVPASIVTDAGGFVRYRPVLNMMVTDFSIDHDEWNRLINWTLSLEEI